MVDGTQTKLLLPPNMRLAAALLSIVLLSSSSHFCGNNLSLAWTHRPKSSPLHAFRAPKGGGGVGDDLVDKGGVAFQTPHSGRHFLPSHPACGGRSLKRLLWRRKRRVMEGWYYRLTLVEKNVSFAFIVSIDDPGLSPPSELSLACIQVIGPSDGYLVQADKDDRKFWAWQKEQALGCTFQFMSPKMENDLRSTTALAVPEWKRSVKSGFQILPDHFLGRIEGHDGSRGGVLEGMGDEGYCEFDFRVESVCGWGGGPSEQQRSTGGWLASYSVFEPHWQVTMADGKASGSVVWNDTNYTFSDEPFYSEKNWGAALPSKWYWTQCNSFDGFEQLSVTAGGGIRKLPLGQSEALGMVGVHYNGTFYEAVPWKGSMEWNVSTWGRWFMRGECTVGERPFCVELSYSCDPEEFPGLVFRAPTPDEGMVYFCRDTFEANVSLTLWELEWDKHTKQAKKKQPPVINNATSSRGGAEVGGGPWWDSWVGKSDLKKPIRVLLRIPGALQSVQRKVRNIL